MGMKRTHDLVAVVGKYKTSGGEEKNRTVRCGSLFTGDDGRVSVKIDSMPVGSTVFEGWLNAYPVDNNRSKPSASVSNDGFDEDVPF